MKTLNFPYGKKSLPRECDNDTLLNDLCIKLKNKSVNGAHNVTRARFPYLHVHYLKQHVLGENLHKWKSYLINDR